MVSASSPPPAPAPAWACAACGTGPIFSTAASISRPSPRGARSSAAARPIRPPHRILSMQAELAKPVVNVLLVEDHPMFRERLASVISKRGDMAVCGEADNVHDAVHLAEKLHPDIAIVDIT